MWTTGLFVFALALAGIEAASTQDVTVFLGEWIGDEQLNASAVSQGILPAGAIAVTITRAGEFLTTVQSSGSVRSSATYRLDGEVYRELVSGREVATRLRWDGAALVLESTTAGRTRVSSLSVDGRRLQLQGKLASGRTVTVHYVSKRP